MTAARRAGMVEEFEEKPSEERLAQLEGVSKNASAEDPFEASMGIYMFKREVPSPPPHLLSCRAPVPGRPQACTLPVPCLHGARTSCTRAGQAGRVAGSCCAPRADPPVEALSPLDRRSAHKPMKWLRHTPRSAARAQGALQAAEGLTSAGALGSCPRCWSGC